MTDDRTHASHTPKTWTPMPSGSSRRFVSGSCRRFVSSSCVNNEVLEEFHRGRSHQLLSPNMLYVGLAFAAAVAAYVSRFSAPSQPLNVSNMSFTPPWLEHMSLECNNAPTTGAREAHRGNLCAQVHGEPRHKRALWRPDRRLHE